MKYFLIFGALFLQCFAYTPEEKEAASRIRDRLSIIGESDEEKTFIEGWLKKTPDTLFLNWLEHRDYNEQAAVEGLRKTLEWRRVNNVENTLLWKSPQVVNDTLYYTITGFSKEGCPVIYADLGHWDIKSLVQSGHRKNVIKYSVQMMEISLREMDNWREKNGVKESPSKFILLGNIEGLSFSQVSSIATIGTISQILGLLETNYPLIHYKAYAINAPGIFSVIVDTIKSVLSSKAFAILKVYGTDENEWRPEIETYIPKEALPESLGGYAKVISPKAN